MYSSAAAAGNPSADGDDTSETVSSAGDNDTTPRQQSPVSDDNDDDNELTKPFLNGPSRRLNKTERRYQTRKTQQRDSLKQDSMGLSQNFSCSASISLRLQNVNKAYLKWLSITRSRSNPASSVTDGAQEEAEPKSLPYHTIIIDCAPITFVDSMGTRALYQVCLCVCVLHIYFCFLPSS